MLRVLSVANWSICRSTASIMGGASRKRVGKESSNASSSRDTEHRLQPFGPPSYSGSLRPSPAPTSARSVEQHSPPYGAPSNSGSARPSPGLMSARGSTPFSAGQSSSGPRSLGARFDGNRSRDGSPAPGAPGSRPASPGPSARGPSRVDYRNLDLPAAAWGQIVQVSGTYVVV